MSNIIRHDAGTKVAGQAAGGQFKAHERNAAAPPAAAAFGTNSRLATMESAPVRVEWIERDVLPTPRHRIPRDITRELTVTPEVRCVTLAETGEAFTVGIDPEMNDGQPLAEYRHFDGELYVPMLQWEVNHNRESPDRWDPVPATEEQLGDLIQRKVSHDWNESAELAETKVHTVANSFLVVDGNVWRRAEEPTYSVMTFGLGGNHGGTSFSMNGRPVDQVNRDDSVFTLDEFEEGRAYALEVAKRRGDTESVSQIENATPIAEVAADRPWRHPISAKRLPGHPSPYDIGWESRDDLQVHENQFQALKEQIRTEAPEAIYTDEEGRKRVDFSRLSSAVEDSYKEFAKRVHELRTLQDDEF